MTYRLVVLLAVLVLVLGMVLLSTPRQESVPAAAAGAPRHDPGYSARNARLVQTGADGRPVYTLDSPQIQQEPNEGTVELEQPRLGFRDANGDQWTARAVHGELTQGSGVVQLDGNVHVSGILPGTGEAAEVITEHLSFDTNAQIVSTADPVKLLMSGRTLAAQGMVALLKERRLQLESDVHGTFLP
jgi:lipopolysaccharide export system protein LptC